MGILKKILKVLETDKLRKKGSVIEPITITKPIYHEKSSKNQRANGNSKKIVFNGKNFDIPEVQVCASILLSGNRNGSEIKSNGEYSLYFEGRYGITNMSKLHQWLYEQGYLRKATLSEALSLYKVPELKTILESLGLKKSGNKSNLVDRVINAIDDSQESKILSQCKHLFLTDKGRQFSDENYDLVLFHRCKYDIFVDEYFKKRFVGNQKRTFSDAAFQILSERAYSYQTKGYFSQLEIIYHNLSDLCYEEGKKELSLQYELYRMYFSTNLSTRTYLFDRDLVKFNGIEKSKSRIDSTTTFNQYTLNRILELKPFFNEQLLNVVYTPEILPYCLFGKHDMLNAIQDLYNGVLDTNKYTGYIRANYGKYIKKFL